MIRLDRWLVTLGLGSRSQVQKLIRSGSVKVNGASVTDPGKQVDEHSAELTVQGQPLDSRLTRHVMLHKPAGLLTAARGLIVRTGIGVPSIVDARVGI
jgi:16S rRNA pseudouridine516 synthase